MSESNEWEPLPTEDAKLRIQIAVMMEMRYLRWAPWRKHMTAEDVLKQTGVEKFTEGLVNRLAGMGLLFRRSRTNSRVSTAPFTWPAPRTDESESSEGDGDPDFCT